jgi:hypothetical protein
LNAGARDASKTVREAELPTPALAKRDLSGGLLASRTWSGTRTVAPTRPASRTGVLQLASGSGERGSTGKRLLPHKRRSGFRVLGRKHQEARQ